MSDDNHYALKYVSIAKTTDTITNQEVLTSDNIALRFSYSVSYRVSDAEKLLDGFDLSAGALGSQIEEYVHLNSQVLLREQIGKITISELNENRQQLFSSAGKELSKLLAAQGIELIDLSIRDLTFPKAIQQVFAEKLMAEVKAQASLEEARAKVAAARAEKNAAEIISQNPEMKFTMLLKTLEKMAEKGRHSFQIDFDKFSAQADKQ